MVETATQTSNAGPNKTKQLHPLKLHQKIFCQPCPDQDHCKTHNTISSSTGVNYPQNILSGIRKTFGFKCDTGLAEAFKPVAKRYFGSICRPLECFMLAVLALQKERVNFGETVNIENLNVLRNLRSRRRLVVEEETEVMVVEGSKDRCAVCGRPSYVRGIRRDDSWVFLCRKHFRVKKLGLKSWRCLEEGVF